MLNMTCAMLAVGGTQVLSIPIYTYKYLLGRTIGKRKRKTERKGKGKERKREKINRIYTNVIIIIIIMNRVRI